ncbi:MAG: helicase-exonuclease AddAB subunit AddA [Bacillota bacterium]|nr:helicase-exonuclease AddAB subunit AddA [Bacillota bacterium]
MRWTEAQQQTIDTRDKNILVSAAAGSGKTAVLIERIKRLMLDGKVDIDKFLITTFTKAASAEMRERLEKAIHEEMKKPDTDKTFLRRQLVLMPNANISTFHTFAIEVLRKYFYLTDLEPGFRIGDEIEVSIMKREAADALFEERFEEDYDAFTEFLKKHSSDRSERNIKENIITLYDNLRSIPDYKEWAAERTALMAETSPIDALGLLEYMEEQCVSAYNKAVESFEKATDMLEEAGLEKLYGKTREDLENLYAWKSSEDYGSLEGFNRWYAGIKFNQMRATKDEKEDYEFIKDKVSAYRDKGKNALKDISKKYLTVTVEESDREINIAHKDTSYAVSLIIRLEEIFKEMKREKNMIDFDDVMHYAIDILRDEKAASEYRSKFQYIFIDEFQDSNMLQETIASKICRTNNLFMVGDVKQSIYKFRLAEPEIFKAKYALYARDEEKESIKIDLNSNFRSKMTVTSLVNNVFHGLMDGYDENAELKCTVPEDYPGIKPQLNIIRNPYKEDGIMDNTQLEVHHAVRLVKESLGTEIFDMKKGIFRPVEYKDIAVLSRNKAMVGDLERALNNAGIPAYGETEGGYFDTVEVQVFINILKVIDNSRQDIPLISVMRCPIFGFNMKELASIRIFSPEGAYHEALRAYAEQGPDEAIRMKAADLLGKIAYWKQLKDTISLEELVRTLLYDTGYYDYCSGLPVGKQRIYNLRLLMERAGSFEKDNYSGLYGFLSYLEAMRTSKKTLSEAKTVSAGENLVQVLTVHKSKGLEFPVIILVGTGKQIRAKGSGSAGAVHKDIGIGLPLVNKEEKWRKKTLIQKVIDSKKAAEEYEEEIRILYVALTRAMDRLVITGVIKDGEEPDEDNDSPKSYMDMLYGPMLDVGGEIIFCDGLDETEEASAQNRRKLSEIYARSRDIDSKSRANIIDEILSYEYPYGELDKVKSKYSVTELNKLTIDEDFTDKEVKSFEGILPQPKFSGQKEMLNAAETGTVMHLLMERTDFATALQKGAPYVLQIADGLLESGELSEAERAVINIENAAAFFREPVGKRAACALRVEKEREFILRKEIDGAGAIVQGIIDCYFEEEDGLVLVDYKNSFMGDRVTEEDIVERYRAQIELYKEALEGAEDKQVKEAYLYLFEPKKFVEVK